MVILIPYSWFNGSKVEGFFFLQALLMLLNFLNLCLKYAQVLKNYKIKVFTSKELNKVINKIISYI